MPIDWVRSGDYEDILYDGAEGIAKITINRPEKVNALNVATVRELDRAAAEAARDDGVRALVLTGAGEKAGFADSAYEAAGVDAIWASNDITGLDNELLAGIGVGGTLTLPWQLVMNFDVGYALTGPGEGGVALRVFLLKLFPKS